jgi:uncharacterized protein (TIGR02145 family)
MHYFSHIIIMKKALIFLPFLFLNIKSGAQSLAINTDGSPADASALLDVNSTSKGILPPRMTTVQRDAITTPATGLVVFNTSVNSLQLYNGTAWVSLITPSTTAVFLPTVVIGTQQWMSSNLDVAFYRNGDPIPQVTDAGAWSALTTGAWCYYNNDSTQGSTYGRIYNWYAVNDPRGLAPIGWHVPSDAEWTTLTTTLGGASVAGGKMKKAGTLNWTAPNTAGNNNSGFTALPAGYRDIFGGYSNLNINGFWWSSTENFPLVPFYRYLEYSNGAIVSNINNKRYGFSVRCIRD